MSKIEEPKFKISTILRFLEKRYGEKLAEDEMKRKSIAFELAKIEQKGEN